MFGRKFQVYLPRRGGRRFLFSVKAKDPDQAREKVLERLEDFREDPSLKPVKHILIIDTKEDTEIRIDNPYFDAEEYERLKNPSKPSIKEFVEASQIDVMNTYVEAINRQLPSMISGLFKGTVQTITSVVDELAKQRLNLQQDPTKPLANIAMFVQSIVLLAQHRDKVLELIRGLKEEGIDIKNLLLAQAGLGGALDVGKVKGRPREA